MTAKAPTLAQIKASWPPAVDVSQAALALGVSRSSAYEAVRCGTFPAKTLVVGHRIRVLTASLVSALENGTAGH
jgi:hypothetical protein